MITNKWTYNLRVLGRKELKGWENEEGTIADSKIPEIVEAFTGMEKSKIFYLQQVHGVDSHEIKVDTQLPIQGDALYTQLPNYVLVIKTADCIPIFFWDKNNPLCGVVHSGWKGTKEKITNIVLDKLLTKISNISLSMYIGPCIRKQNYEIGEDVAFFFKEKYPESLANRGDKYLFGNDLVLKKDIECYKYSLEDSNICNFENSYFYSHRKKDKGRNLNLIWMNFS